MKKINTTGRRNILRLVLFGIALLSTENAQSFLDYQLLEKDGKRILIMGWLHTDVLHNQNNALLQALIKIEGSPSRPAHFIFEEHSLEQLQQFKEKPLSSLIIDSLRALKSTHVLSYEAYDPRAESSCAINDLLIKFLGLAAEFERKVWVKPGDIAGEVISPLSVASYLQDLQVAEDQIKTWRDSVDSSSEAYNVLAQKLEQYKKAHEQVRALLNDQRPNKSLAQALLGLLIHYIASGNISGAQFKSYVDSLNSLFVLNSDYVFAEAGFLYRALTSDVNLIMLIGLVHAQTIEENLLHLGYKTVSKASTLKVTPGGFEYHAENFRRYGAQLLDVYYNLLTGLELGLASEHQEDERKLTSLCAQCGAQPQKLMACSACKKVKYCDAACQRKHWPAHKALCQKK